MEMRPNGTNHASGVEIGKDLLRDRFGGAYYLRSQQPTPGLRRLIVENRDTMARALRTQAFDRT